MAKNGRPYEGPGGGLSKVTGERDGFPKWRAPAPYYAEMQDNYLRRVVEDMEDHVNLALERLFGGPLA
jgi:hypothetical protein